MANLVGGVITMVILIVLGAALLPTVADFTIGKQGSGNVTGSTSTLLGIVPIFYVIGLFIGVLAGAGIYKMRGN